VFEPGESIGHDARENRSGVAVVTSGGRDRGMVSKAGPGEASVQVTAAFIGMSVGPPARAGDSFRFPMSIAHREPG
jgi:hypothetical protein